MARIEQAAKGWSVGVRWPIWRRLCSKLRHFDCPAYYFAALLPSGQRRYRQYRITSGMTPSSDYWCPDAKSGERAGYGGRYTRDEQRISIVAAG